MNITCLSVWQKFSQIHPEWRAVDIEDLLPIPEPRDHEETPRFFYENVMKPLVTTTVELLETPMPIDMDVIQEIKQEALNQKEPAFAKLQEFPKVKEYMEKVREQLIYDFTYPLQQQKDNWSVKEYRHNAADRTILLNHLTKETKKMWKITDIKEYISNE